MIEGLFRALNNPSCAGVEFTAPTYAAIETAFKSVVAIETDLKAVFILIPGRTPHSAWAIKKDTLDVETGTDQEDPLAG